MYSFAVCVYFIASDWRDTGLDAEERKPFILIFLSIAGARWSETLDTESPLVQDEPRRALETKEKRALKPEQKLFIFDNSV